MTITAQHTEELISVAYVYAIAAQAGMNIMHGFFDYGVDVTISYVQTLQNGERRATGYDLKFQVKSSINTILEDDFLVYDLEAKTFNTLVTWPGPTPCYLLVMRLSSEVARRVETNEELLSLRDCCYWHKVPIGVKSTNKRSVRIRIPRCNQLTPDSLVSLMNEIRNGVHA